MDAIAIDSLDTPSARQRNAVVDGRTARRNRNKDAVLDALIELTREGVTEPRVEAIAERAGVSYRSVYRYFDDRTELMLAAIGRLMDDVWPALEVGATPHGTLDDRIAEIVSGRVEVYRKLAPLTRAAVHRRSHEPMVAERYDRVRELLRSRLAAQFEPELGLLSVDERRVVLAALDVAFQFEALDYLAQHDQMTDRQLEQVLTRQIRAHLGTIAASLN